MSKKRNIKPETGRGSIYRPKGMQGGLATTLVWPRNEPGWVAGMTWCQSASAMGCTGHRHMKCRCKMKRIRVGIAE